MRALTTRKLNALRMMVAGGVIRAAHSKHDEFIHRQHQVRTENPAAEFDHLAPFNVLAPTTRSVCGNNHVSHFASLL